MIDTMKFAINISKDNYLSFKNFDGYTSTKKDNKENQPEVRFLKIDVPIPSFDRKITIFCPDEETALIEFSLPKLLNGHNIALISSVEVIQAVRKLHQDFQKYYDIRLPPYKNWLIRRLDFCYIWKLNTNEDETKVLSVLQSLDYLKSTKKHIYSTSVMWTSQSYSFKYYLKHPEYLRNDYDKLIKDGKQDLAVRLLNDSKRVLRFEVTLRSAKIKALFSPLEPKFSNLFEVKGKSLEDFAFETLNKFNSRLWKGLPKIQDKLSVFELLEAKYGRKKARRLEEYWNMYQSDDTSKKKVINNYSRSQKWLYEKEIKNAGVGRIYKNFNISLEIDRNKLLLLPR